MRQEKSVILRQPQTLLDVVQLQRGVLQCRTTV